MTVTWGRDLRGEELLDYCYINFYVNFYVPRPVQNYTRKESINLFITPFDSLDVIITGNHVHL